jgi:hypothetical protein
MLQIEVLSAINGDLRFTVSNANDDGVRPEDDPVVGLHLFAGQKLELTSRYCKIVAFWVLTPDSTIGASSLVTSSFFLPMYIQHLIFAEFIVNC